MHCSKLNAHLYSLHVVPSPACACGFESEDSTHYLLKCPLFHNSRVKMLASIAAVSTDIVLDTNLLLYGSKNISKENVINIFSAVHTFIEETNRL